MPFSFDRLLQTKKDTKRPFPSAADIPLGGVRRYVTPPPAIVATLGGKVPLIGVDIETHNWTGGRSIKNKWSIGQCGFYNICMPCDIDEPRIVQIGWAVRGVAERWASYTEVRKCPTHGQV